MAIGEVRPVEVGDVTDLYYVDTGMFDVPEYGAVYIADADRPAVIDTGLGTNYERVLGALETVGIAPEDLAVIAPTHVHLDHAGGAGYLAAACPNAEVAIHRIGAPHLIDPEDLVAGTKRAVGDQWEFYADPEPVPADRVRELEDGDRLDLGDRRLDVHHAPGHAPHQVVYHDPAGDALFTADAAGIWVDALGEVHPTSPPPNFDLEGCLADIETQRALDPTVLCYAHFGPTRADGVLEQYATVLEDWVAEVERRRREFDSDEALIEHFVAEAKAEFAGVWSPRRAEGEASINVRGVLVYLDRRADDD